MTLAGETTHQHFVRFEIRDEGRVSAEFHCTAADDADCRRWCSTCINEDRDRCECDELNRKPVLSTYRCNYLQWMGDAPDECYDGPSRYIPGPDLVPVTFTWEGDYFTWCFADAPDVKPATSAKPASTEVEPADDSRVSA